MIRAEERARRYFEGAPDLRRIVLKDIESAGARNRYTWADWRMLYRTIREVNPGDVLAFGDHLTVEVIKNALIDNREDAALTVAMSGGDVPIRMYDFVFVGVEPGPALATVEQRADWPMRGLVDRRLTGRRSGRRRSPNLAAMRVAHR